MELNYYLKIFCVLAVNYSLINCSTIRAYKASERSLDSEGKYLLSWEVDDKEERVTFQASVQTTGYVGLGISPNGGMQGADIFVGGVNSQNGEPYFSDLHGVGERMPEQDSQKDWDLIKAVEDNGWTNLTFSRLLNTCDSNDVPITYEATTRLIYSFGSSDSLAYHGVNRGSVPTSILDKEQDSDDLSTKFKTWSVTINMTMPNIDTSYWCTIHKRKSFGGLHHVVGFDAFLENNTTAKKHAHHLVLHKCYPPSGSSAEEIFEEFVHQPGEECYAAEAGRLPKHFCLEYMFIWATGGKTTLFPDDVGHPIEETENESPYFMLEIHYDNPERLSNITFQTGVTVYYTDDIRKKEAGLMTTGNDLGPSLTVPPDTDNFVLSGHCSDHCTKNLPNEGINVFNILLHSHLSGRQMRVRHFRGNKELPWLYSDSSYDFNFQQNKALKQHVKILPRDHLVTECTYSSRWNNGFAIQGGFKTNEEMCTSHIWYYPRIKNLDYCASSYNLEKNFNDFGITNYEMPNSPNGPVMIWAPKEMEGLTYVEAISTKFNWTEDFRKDFQFKRRYGEQEQVCAVLAQGPEFDGTLTKYPNAVNQYVPEDTCKSSNSALKTQLPISGVNSLPVVFIFYNYLFVLRFFS